MNRWLTRSAPKPLALGGDGRSFLAAPVKLTALGQISEKRNGGYGFLLVGMLTKMMSTVANGESRINKKEKMLPVLFKPKKFIRYGGGFKGRVVKHDIDGFPRCRSNEEIRRMFEEWIVLFHKVYANAEEKERRYDIFKGKVRFIEENDEYSTNRRLGLNYFSDMTPKEYFTMKAEEEEDQRVTSTIKAPRCYATGNHYHPHHGCGIWAARSNLMSTSAMGPKNICGAASEDKDESSNKSPSPYLKQTEIYLEDFVSMRNDEEIAAMFHIWCVDHRRTYCSVSEKMKGFKCFKSVVKFLEEANAKISEPDSRLLLNHSADWTPKSFFHTLFCW